MTQPPHDVGRVHVADVGTGLCAETCPHPHHGQVVVVAMTTDLKALLDEWLAALDLAAEFVPTPVEDFDGRRVYAVLEPPRQVPPLDGALRVGNPPRTRR